MTESIPLPPQPALLTDFPRVVLRADARLWRLHLSDRAPNGFATDTVMGRFNPPGGDTRFGTCYVADDAVGAFLETLGRSATGTIDEADILIRSLSMMSLAADAELADLTAPEARGRFGLTGEMSAGGPTTYTRCQAWAAALHEAGSAGIRYRARHDPGLGTTSYAIFGTPGIDDKVFAPASTFPVPAEWIDELAHRYGFRIVPRNNIL